MKRSRLIGLGLVGMALLAISAVMIWQQASHTNSAEGSVALQRPLFADTAYAGENDTSAIGEKLDSEAGISAYFKSSSVINLNDVRDQFTTIEAETNNYIIGSVSIPDYDEVYDVHVYVNKNGWMIAYYLKEDPAAKIGDVAGNQVHTSLLETALSLVGSQAGISLSEVTYYDFRYPNATHLLLIGEDSIVDSSFKLTVPSSFGYFERSYGFKNPYSFSVTSFYVDGKRQSDIYNLKGHSGYGLIEASDLSSNVPHTISYDSGSYAVVAIVYRVP